MVANLIKKVDISKVLLVVDSHAYCLTSYEQSERIATIEYKGRTIKFYGDGILGKGPCNSWRGLIDGVALDGKLVWKPGERK